MYTHNEQHCNNLLNCLLCRAVQVSWYQKKHSLLAPYLCKYYSISLINVLHGIAIRCYSKFLSKFSLTDVSVLQPPVHRPCIFTQSFSPFLEIRLYNLNPFSCKNVIISSVPSVSLNSIHVNLSNTEQYTSIYQLSNN